MNVRTATYFKRVVIFGIVVIFAIISSALTKLDMASNPHFDVYDEGAHYDYVLQLSQGNIPAWGDQYLQETVRIVDCLGTAFSPAGSCEIKHRTTENYAPNGFNYEAQQGPIGYLPYLLGIVNSEEPSDQLQGMRLKGSYIWLTLSGSLLILLCLALRTSIFMASLASIAIFLNPTFIHSISTVNNDAAIVPIVLFWILIELFLRDRKLSWRSVRNARFVIGLVFGLTKALLLVVPISIFLLGVFLVLKAKRISRRKVSLKTFDKFQIAPMMLGAISSYGTFLALQKLREKIPSSQVLEALLGFSKTDVPDLKTMVDSFANVLFIFSGGYPGANINGSSGLIVTAVITALISIAAARSWDYFKGLKLSILDAQTVDIFKAFPLVSVVALAMTAISWPLLFYMQGNYNFASPSRYALLAVPLLIVSLMQHSRTSKHQ